MCLLNKYMHGCMQWWAEDLYQSILYYCVYNYIHRACGCGVRVEPLY